MAFSDTPTNSQKEISIYTYIGLFLALIFPILYTFLGKQIFAGNPNSFLIGEIIFWSITVLLLLLVRNGEQKSFQSIGFQAFQPKTLAWAMLCLVALLVAAVASIALINAIGLKRSAQTLSTLSALPFFTKVLLALRAGVYEEIMFRGFAIERLSSIMGNRWIPALISLVIFTVIHLQGWGAAHLIMVAVLGTVLTGFYLWKRNLWIVIIAHFLFDLLSFVAPPPPSQ